jgi:hypothetical protein
MVLFLSVVRFLKSTHADERDAAVYAAKRLAKSSSEFSETVLDAIIPLVGSSATSSNISTHSKLQLLSIVPFLSLTFATAQTVRSPVRRLCCTADRASIT